MTKNYKDMTQDEIRGLLSEKTSELYDLAKEIKRETEFAVLLFSTVGVSNGDTTSSSHCALGDIVGLANLLNNENDYHDIANVIEMYKLKKILGIDDDKED
ncbi:phage protein [Staphylococcus aureus]|uniref:Phage like protein n=1 Tax=Staphylococcus aureus TaxID=1280 RepID=A0AAU9GSS5_STAAU|nr:DUF2482 family protein [Staphylococcus aureus]CAA3799386.1 phage like protein [Staphylococcus aureus]CAA3891605.1 phage like protein [Staphylococcus aureus]CAA4132002.1 phage like protein [Staphylococcus aureus]CAA4133879.1 phage like protein [Staphylococcus aureus]CAA4158943.1 phage like protein [Staphylococcus aureus]